MSTNGQPPFSLIVNLEFKDESVKDQFLKDIAPLAKYVHDKEPDTLAYEALLSDKDPLKVVILERYKDKDRAFLEVHRNSIPFQVFRPKLKAMMDEGHVTMVGESYVDSMLGFGDRVQN
jgi:quinol monooxygenase YgiN